MTVSEQALQEKLREMALAVGASYFGVADLRPVRDFVTAQGGDFLADYPVGVSVGVALADGVVDQLHQHLDGNVARTYYHHIYIAVAAHLDRIAAGLAFHLERSGYRAIPVAPGRPFNEQRLTGLVSHKLAAHLAGVGWIGKNCLLITRAHGPRVRWVTVLTDAPLPSTGALSADGDRCKSCTLCVDLCPAQAFSGRAFDPAEPVEVRFRRYDCHKYLRERDKAYGARVCGVCVYVCPHGWSTKRKKTGARTTPEVVRHRLEGARSAFERSLQPL